MKSISVVLLLMVGVMGGCAIGGGNEIKVGDTVITDRFLEMHKEIVMASYHKNTLHDLFYVRTIDGSQNGWMEDCYCYPYKAEWDSVNKKLGLK